MIRGCRFCYSYTPPGIKETCCPDPPCIPSEIEPPANRIGSQTTEQSLLQAIVQKQQLEIQQTAQQTTLQNILANEATITKTLQNELVQVAAQRYQPYQPYIYPVIPRSVLEFEMRTANVGNPMPPITIADCKGSQFVTK